jgi:molybdenum cofactor biosynthesis enzyme
MKKYHFDDSDIKIDHKKEELRIIVSVKLADKTAISMSFY